MSGDYTDLTQRLRAMAEYGAGAMALAAHRERRTKETK